jgi:hypothetical protein
LSTVAVTLTQEHHFDAGRGLLGVAGLAATVCLDAAVEVAAVVRAAVVDVPGRDTDGERDAAADDDGDNFAVDPVGLVSFDAVGLVSFDAVGLVNRELSGVAVFDAVAERTAVLLDAGVEGAVLVALTDDCVELGIR